MAGIGKIEKKLKDKLELTDKNISKAFQDLDQLINMAQQMAVLSKSIANKIKEHGAEVTDNETIQFKSYLMELGIEQQIDIGKSCTSSKEEKNIELAKQIESVVLSFMEHFKKDQVTLSDVYCIFNRARGVDLLSPDDIIEACKHLNKLKVVKHDNGLIVVQRCSLNENELNEQILKITKDNVFMTPMKLSQILQLPLQLARHRLIQSEHSGLLCRDVSIEGLKFYPNYFLYKPKDEDVFKFGNRVDVSSS